MNANQSLIVIDRDLQISLKPEIESAKEEALAQSALIARVTNQNEVDTATEAQRKLQTVVKAVETSRKQAKEPLLEAGRLLDKVCKDFSAELISETTRLAKLNGNFQEAELQRVRAAEALRQKELLEIERQREAEKAKAKTLEEADKINETFNERVAEAAPPVQPVRAQGQIVREDWDIVVTDIHQLYRHHPLCCKVTPLMSEIRQLLDSGVKVAGVNAKKVVKSSVRIGSERKAIEV